MPMQNRHSLPTQLETLANDRYYEFSQSNDQYIEALNDEKRELVRQVFALSDFAFEQISLHPQWLAEIFSHQLLQSSALQGVITQRIGVDLATINNDKELDRILRLNRNFFQLVIAWRDLCQLIDIEQSMLDVSFLAETLIIVARDYLYENLAITWGYPVDEHTNKQPLIILGMGKLGGGELNFSSDIDLIFSFPHHGQTQGGRRSTDNQQFFVKLGQRLITALDKLTVDGFVYRVDMRLRPFGNSGPLVVSFSALEDYYQSQGRDWERYAMVKGRVLGPDNGYSQELTDLLRPFMFRRYIDFSAIESLRQMKRLISHEVRRRGLIDNIKLGSGGIREVEFIVQAFQMIRGGREPTLRKSSLLTTLVALQRLDIFTAQECKQLKQSYLYLRRCEQYLQQFADKQTQTLPENDQNWARLCYLFDCDTEQQFRLVLGEHTALVQQLFSDVVGSEQDEEDDESKQSTILKVLFEADSDFDGESVLFEMNCPQPEVMFAQIQEIKHDLNRRPMGPRGQESMSKLMPLVLLKIVDKDDCALLLSRIGNIFSKISTRTAYIELLLENPGALNQFITLCQASSWICEKLTQFPILLDELLDPKLLYSPTPLDQYKRECELYLLRVPEDDMEQMMESLRQYKQTQQLRIAAADVTGVMSVTNVSDHLTALAEAIIEYVVELSWQQMVARYGQPVHSGNDKGFAVIGYGKLGGLELGYGSDLDLVFLHCASIGHHTDGEKAIDSHHFYLKLAQRFIHLFNTRTNSGILYEVDMRLRPSGNAGLMVSHVNTFAQYQRSEAWVWEHQALVRARIVSGDDYIEQLFSVTRKEILLIPRSLIQLQEDVAKMRVKMRDHLSKGSNDVFDLKHDNGGVADIEFIAQYLVLGYSHCCPVLTRYSDNIRIFESLLDLNLLSNEQAKGLSAAYCEYRNRGHHLVLQNKDNQTASSEFVAQRELVRQCWRSLMLTAP